MKNLDMFGSEELKIFNASDLLSLQCGNTSKGNQMKWYDSKNDFYIKAQFYFQDKFWRDDLVECAAAQLGKQFCLADKRVQILEQSSCKIDLGYNTIYGVCSKNFCNPGEVFVPFSRILNTKKRQFPYSGSIETKWAFVLDTLNNLTKSDCSDYLLVMSLLDFLIGNEDRHLSNFGVIYCDGKFRISPLFDFGLGLFEHDRKYENLPLKQCISKMECKPFARYNEDLITFISDEYAIKEYLPEKFDLTGIELPSLKASSYILNRAKMLNVEVIGV